MTRCLIAATLCLSSGVLSDVLAQPVVRIDTLREAEAVTRAVTTSAPARSTAAQVDAARASALARSTWWAEAPEVEAATALPTDGLFSANEYRVEAGVSARLEAPAVRRARLASAMAEQRQAEAEARAVLAERAFDVLERYATFGYEPFPATREQFNAFVASESAKYADVIKRAKVALD